MRVWLFETPWTVAYQSPLSSTISRSLLKFMSTVSVMPSNHLILCHSFLLLPSIFPSIRVFSNESALQIRWPKYWSFSISPSNACSGLAPLGWPGWTSLRSKGLSGVFSSTTVCKHQFFGAQPSSQTNSHITRDYWKNHSFDYMDLRPRSSVVKNLPAKQEMNLWVVKILWRREGNPLQYSCLEIPWTEKPGGLHTAHGVVKKSDMTARLNNNKDPSTGLSQYKCEAASNVLRYLC